MTPRIVYGAELMLYLHCKENPIYVFLFWKLRSLSPNFHIHVSVSDVFIPRIGPHNFLQQNRQHWETEHYNSVLEITISFLGVHKWEPDIYIGFSSALQLQCMIRGAVFQSSNLIRR